MTAICLHILLHILIINVRVGLQQFLVEAGLVERLQVHFYGFKAVLDATGDDFRVEDEGEEFVYLVGELLVGGWKFADEGVVD